MKRYDPLGLKIRSVYVCISTWLDLEKDMTSNYTGRKVNLNEKSKDSSIRHRDKP